MNRLFSLICVKIANILGKSYVFMINLILVIIATSICIKFPESTIMLVFNTFLSVMSYLILFILQNTQNKDGRAIQLKLDELIRSNEKSHNILIGIENKTLEELQEVTDELQHEVDELEKQSKES